MSTIDVSSETNTVTETVKNQYESYPYPHRDPEDENQRVIHTIIDDLGAINHYCNNGKKNYSDGKFLVAGGGTGDATIHLASQLQNTNAEIVHIDLSQASMDIAYQRAKVHGWHNRIQWLKGSLLDLNPTDHGTFDYINCSGVLHHLEDPTVGLAALNSVLKSDGVIGLMLYGKYGRTGIYHMQEMMRLVNQAVPQAEAQVQQTRKVLSTLPPTNWCRRGAALFNDLDNVHDVEIYDMFLHSTDRAYSIPELFEFLEDQGLSLVESTILNRALFKPEIAFQDPQLLYQIQQLSREKQLAACELFWGSVSKHEFWAAKNPAQIASFEQLENVPYFGVMGTKISDRNVQQTILNAENKCWSMQLSQPAEMVVEIQFNQTTHRFIELINDQRTIGEIVEQLAEESDGSQTNEEIQRMCKKAFDALLIHDLILLRGKEIKIPTATCN